MSVVNENLKLMWMVQASLYLRVGGSTINADKEWMCDRQIVSRQVTARHASHAQARPPHAENTASRGLEVDNTSSTANTPPTKGG